MKTCLMTLGVAGWALLATVAFAQNPVPAALHGKQLPLRYETELLEKYKSLLARLGLQVQITRFDLKDPANLHTINKQLGVFSDALDLLEEQAVEKHETMNLKFRVLRLTFHKTGDPKILNDPSQGMVTIESDEDWIGDGPVECLQWGLMKFFDGARWTQAQVCKVGVLPAAPVTYLAAISLPGIPQAQLDAEAYARSRLDSDIYFDTLSDPNLISTYLTAHRLVVFTRGR